jgi:hypothetical protein
MTSLPAARWTPTKGAWFTVTLLTHLVLFAVAVLLCLARPSASVLLMPAAGLVLASTAAVVMLAMPPWRRVGVRLLGATVVALVVDVLALVTLMAIVIVVQGD